jgi:hypothetical protein
MSNTNEDSGLPDRNSFVRAPVQISAERFDEMLNILPPRDWRGSRGAQSFKMSELIYDDIAVIFAERNGHYFELRDSCRLPHAEIMSKCAAFAA